MLKKHMAACLVVTAFAAAPALAQTSTTPAPTPSGPTDRPAAAGSGSATTGSPAMQPGAASPAPTAQSTAGQGGAMQVQFMTQMQPNQMKASDLIGTRVISSNNESIGDINDVILDRNGQAMAAVVGVGGFLGIGEKNVAVPFNALEFATREQVSAMSNAGGNVTATGSTAAPGTAGGSTATGTSSTTAGTSASSDNEPERVILRMTKAELEAAPKFVEDADDANRSNTGSTGVSGQPATGTTTAPKQ